jgi:hypothetical protein
VGKVTLCACKRYVGEGENRTQYICLPQTIEEIGEEKGSLVGPVLQEKGRLGKRIIY